MANARTDYKEFIRKRKYDNDNKTLSFWRKIDIKMQENIGNY